MNPILKLETLGQSCWLDNLTRAMITSGELHSRVAQEGIRGVTSNPSIFSKAISKGKDYDEQIRSLAAENRSLQEIYEAVVVKDVQDACDILRTVHEASGGTDGFVSLEVSPYLAHDTQGTLEEARRLFKAVNRGNCLIKIPGTPAGVPAIEESLYEGVNVNITLLFSLQSYETVAEAYVRALERRASEGKPVDTVASVASFFLSRIDLLVDQLLSHLITSARGDGPSPRAEQLFGKAAVASAKLAYQSFKRIFSGDRWRALVHKGARVQYPLWASTSTKDPLYPDTCYVAPLIGPDTINTMPEETIAAFAGHGTAESSTIERELEEARQVFRDLEKVGVDLDFVTRQLVNEGIQKFIDPFDKLMNDLAAKHGRFPAEGSPRQQIRLGEYQAGLTATLRSLDGKQATRRLFARDPFLWARSPEEARTVGNRLGWIGSAEHFLDRAGEITRFAEEIKNTQYRHTVLAGMGGSSLCPEVTRQTFGSRAGWPELLVLDNTDPAAVRHVLSQIEPSKTLFLIASKSGTTTETTSFYRYFYDRVGRRNSPNPGDHFVAITDPGTPLAREARERGFRRIFENPADIGGRYSALSYFGLVPMALTGISIEPLLKEARQMAVTCGPFVPAESNPAVMLGAALGVCQGRGRDKITFALSESVSSFGVWLEQLLAESTGKAGVGLIPVEGEMPAKEQLYGRDRLFLFLTTAEDQTAKLSRRRAALEKAGHPTVLIEIADKTALGGEFLRWELATAIAGAVMRVNPFDEPNVAESKRNTRDLLAEWRQTGDFGDEQPVLAEDGIALFCDASAPWMFDGSRGSARQFLGEFLGLSRQGDYAAILPFFFAKPPRRKKLQNLRIRVARHTNAATTLGYGPRYLHSTGQLHKGGPESGIYIVLTADAGRDIRIPGEDFGFATLQRAQALGDYRSLKERRRRVIRIHLGRSIDKGLTKLVKELG